MVNREYVTKIVAAYVQRNEIADDQVGALISSVYQALADIGKPPADTEVDPVPGSVLPSVLASIAREWAAVPRCGVTAGNGRRRSSRVAW
jgi:predicted transcriptional regulator